MTWSSEQNSRSTRISPSSLLPPARFCSSSASCSFSRERIPFSTRMLPRRCGPAGEIDMGKAPACEGLAAKALYGVEHGFEHFQLLIEPRHFQDLAIGSIAGRHLHIAAQG